MYLKKEPINYQQTKSHEPKSTLSVIEIRLEKRHTQFAPFLFELLEKIDCSIECLLNSARYSHKDPVMIVSHEYLYGNDHSEEGMDETELQEFESRLQSKTNELAKKYALNIALCPGTIVVKGEQVSNRAYFFTPENPVRYTNKMTEYYKLFDWHEKKVLISICCNWARFKYDDSRPKADIYFIPSSGFFFISDFDSAAYVGMAAEASRIPGIIYINSDRIINGRSGIFRTKDSVVEKRISFCKEPGHLEHLERPEAHSFSETIKVFVVQINPFSFKHETHLLLTKEPKELLNSKEHVDPIDNKSTSANNRSRNEFFSPIAQEQGTDDSVSDEMDLHVSSP